MTESAGAGGSLDTLDDSILLPSLPPALTSLEWQDWTVTASLKLAGYQLWAVEQQVTDRSSMLPVIVVFTGDTNDTISVNRFSLSPSLAAKDRERLWDQARLKLRASGAKLTQARDEQGWIGLTSLPSLNPNLSIVHLPGGDYQDAVPLLYANINLRRLGLGGRSSLRLAPATPAQQLHLRQSFRLPIPAPSSASHHHHYTSFSAGSTVSGSTAATDSDAVSPFTETILSLIQLTQHALSLFGLGVVRVPLRTAGSVPAPDPAPPVSEEHADALGSHLPPSRFLAVGDGLLCDTTLAALSYFRFEVAEPLVHLPKGEESVLNPSLLSALVSTVCGARGKMQAMGEDVPRDPLDRRARFLSAVASFAKHHRLPPTSHLSTTFLLSLAQLYHSHLHPSSTLNPVVNLNTQRRRGAQKVSRALRTRLGDEATGIGGEEGEIETASLEKLITEMGRGLGGATAQRLWGVEGKEGRRERRRESKERAKERKERERDKTDGEVEDERRGGGTASEGETLGGGDGGRVLGVLKGVKERAGRAGRKFGDNLGFTDAHYASTAAPNGSSPPIFSSTAQNKLAPSLLISSAVSPTPSRSHSPTKSRSATLNIPAIDPNALAPSPTNATATTSSSGNTAVSTTGPSSKAATFAARVASALSSEGAATAGPRAGSVAKRAEGRSGSSKSPSASRSGSRIRGVPLGEVVDSLEALPVTRMPPVRRSATDVPGGIVRLFPASSPVQEPSAEGFEQDDSASALDEEEVVVEEDMLGAIGRAGGTVRRSRGSGSRLLRPTDRRRRHSFNITRDAPEPWLNLSRKRLVLDVNLRMTYWTLHQREKKLAEMVEALRTVNCSYEQAIASLKPLLAAKTARLNSLTSTAVALSSRAESYTSPSSPLSKLSVGSSRLLYAQSVVEEKLGDVTDFARIVQAKVGEGGTLEKGTRELGAERMGVRKLVKSVERWRVWLAGLAFGGLRRREDP